MKIAVEGCAHGELEKIYETIALLEQRDSVKIDLLICCGDFQATRNKHDLQAMAVPVKYQSMCSFYKYYSGEKLAPILTVFIGGNHEASNYLQELPYGGWVAPNIYYLGYAGVINISGVRIGGISGIYKGGDYLKGRHERPPYTGETKRSVYHVRNLDVFRLKQISEAVDVFISHDWPANIWKYGDCDQLLRFKPFLRSDMESNRLGSRPGEELLHHLKPQYWFAAHMHCKFAAMVRHGRGSQTTKFLALDKCLPKRRFLQVFDMASQVGEVKIEYDLEWLSVLRLTNHLTSVKRTCNYLPGEGSTERYNFVPTREEKAATLARFPEENLTIPLNFVRTAECHDPNSSAQRYYQQLPAKPNPQTTVFCEILKVDDPLVLLNGYAPQEDSPKEDLPKEDSSSMQEDSYSSFVRDTPKRSLSRLNLPPPKFTPDAKEDAEAKSFNVSANVSEKLSFLSYSSPLAKRFKKSNCELYTSTND